VEAKEVGLFALLWNQKNMKVALPVTAQAK
jgi:hypothetical protein